MCREQIDIRNKLITLSLHDELTKARAIKTVLRAMAASYMAGRDSESYLAYRGCVDYCNGTDFLFNTEPEQLNNEIRAIAKGYTKSSRLMEMFKLLKLMLKTVNAFNRGFDKASTDYKQNYRAVSSYDSWCRYLGVEQSRLDYEALAEHTHNRNNQAPDGRDNIKSAHIYCR